MSQHEHAPLTRREETELALISHRLRRDGVRLDRRPAREWPAQLVGTGLAAVGGAFLAWATTAGTDGFAIADAVVGGVLVVVSVFLTTTVVRRALVRRTTAAIWRVMGPAELAPRWWRRRRSLRRSGAHRRSI